MSVQYIESRISKLHIRFSYSSYCILFRKANESKGTSDLGFDIIDRIPSHVHGSSDLLVNVHCSHPAGDRLHSGVDSRACLIVWCKASPVISVVLNGIMSGAIVSQRTKSVVSKCSMILFFLMIHQVRTNGLCDARSDSRVGCTPDWITLFFTEPSQDTDSSTTRRHTLLA